MEGFELVREDLGVDVERSRQVEHIEEFDLVHRRQDTDCIARRASNHGVNAVTEVLVAVPTSEIGELRR